MENVPQARGGSGSRLFMIPIFIFSNLIHTSKGNLERHMLVLTFWDIQLEGIRGNDALLRSVTLPDQSWSHGGSLALLDHHRGLLLGLVHGGRQVLRPERAVDGAGANILELGVKDCETISTGAVHRHTLSAANNTGTEGCRVTFVNYLNIFPEMRTLFQLKGGSIFSRHLRNQTIFFAIEQGKRDLIENMNMFCFF